MQNTRMDFQIGGNFLFTKEIFIWRSHAHVILVMGWFHDGQRDLVTELGPPELMKMAAPRIVFLQINSLFSIFNSSFAFTVVGEKSDGRG